MSNADEIRWRQRFDKFQKAFLLLQDTLLPKLISGELRAGETEKSVERALG